MRIFVSWILAVLAFLLIQFSCNKSPQTTVLVFSKTEGFRHESIPEGIKAIQELGSENNFEVEVSEDASIMSQKYLKNIQAIIFLNTTMDILNPSQQIEFKRFIQAGGGFVGIHAAADTEYKWPWYGKLVGAYFNGHPNNPNVREAVVRKTENHDPSTEHLPDAWTRQDEWYNYKNINPDIIPILNLDETTYEGGTNGSFHPIAWYHEFDGGRSFYTGGGHTDESFQDDAFRLHLLKGIEYAMGNRKEINYEQASVMPEESRFRKVVLDSYFNEPMELDLLPDGRIVFIERKGAVKLYDPSQGKTRTVTNLEVYSGQEDGLMGIALHPDFADNHWAFICYSDPGESVQNLSRFTFDPDAEEVLSDERVLLTVPTQRLECCHSAGSVEFGPEGDLWASFGDNTNPHQSNGYAPIDERQGRFPFDAQKSSGNPNDLRGGIIRIHPEDDGTYSIPDGNLFNKDGSEGRPEIYVMGCRNPFRFSVDSETLSLYWGEVGPDAQDDGISRGPRGYDEVNQAKGPGFFGWPYFIGNNKKYFDYDFVTLRSGNEFDPLRPINNSPFNTGSQDLPPAQPAMVWYPYAESEEFPLLGTGGRNAMAGPIFHQEDYPDNPRRYPAYYDDKLFIYDWMRGWIMAVSFDENGDYAEMEPFLPSIKWNNLMDVVMSPDGDMYMIEYGTGWFTANEDARLVHLEFNAGNRMPMAKLEADNPVGGLPLTVNFDASGSTDQDSDDLTYTWDFGDGQTGKGMLASHTYKSPGEFSVDLTVRDEDGLESKDHIKIFAGNHPPEVNLVLSGNQKFYWPENSVDYEVTVNDQEDGTIDTNNIVLTLDYLEQGYDITEIAQGHQISSEIIQNHPGLDMIQNSDCRSCHKINGVSIGPSYILVAGKYEEDANAATYLADKIISGGGGVWGETAMAAHPAISSEDATTMAKYILSLDDESTSLSLGSKGSYALTIPDGKEPGGNFVFIASYTDQGAEGTRPLKSQKTTILQTPVISAPSAATLLNATKFVVTPEMNPGLKENLPVVIANDGAELTYPEIDLTGINSIIVIGNAPSGFMGGGNFELYFGQPDPQLLGSAELKTGDLSGQPQQLLFPIDNVPGIGDLVIKVKSKKEDLGAGILISIILNP